MRPRHWALGVTCGLAMAAVSGDSRAGDANPLVVVGVGAALLAPVPVFDLIVIGLDLKTLGEGQPLSRSWATGELLLGVVQVISGSLLVGWWASEFRTHNADAAGYFGVPMTALGICFMAHSIWSLGRPEPPASANRLDPGGRRISAYLGPTARTPTWNTGLERTPPPSSPFVLPLYSGSF